MRASRKRLILTGVIAALLAACGSKEVRDRAPSGRITNLPGDAVPRPEGRSRYGNAAEYEVFGKKYRVMDSAQGYRERGVASWYGEKFHGRLTSNRETYNMYAMTAAHKSLPLPTYVEVRNLRNNKTVVVRVNDRGPFVHNRIIDLSYSAALKLDMVNAGTSLVEVRAITFEEPPRERPTRTVTRSPTISEPPVRTAPPEEPTPKVMPAEAIPDDSSATGSVTDPGVHEVYVQVGAFGSAENAQRRHTTLLNRGIGNAYIHRDTASEAPIYRVRIGPIVNGEQYDLIVEELAKLGITDPYLVSD